MSKPVLEELLQKHIEGKIPKNTADDIIGVIYVEGNPKRSEILEEINKITVQSTSVKK